jgi:hypothetical protein
MSRRHNRPTTPTDLDLTALAAELHTTPTTRALGAARSTAGAGADAPTEPTPAELLHSIRWDVYRLALTTEHAPTRGTGPDSSERRRRITRVPLLTELRDAIRPDQGGNDRGRGSSGSRAAADLDALELYDTTAETIRTMHEGAFGRPPHGTPEQLLIEWFHDLERDYRNNQLTPLILTTYAQRLTRTRRTIENHFDPPRVLEVALCPSCGHTHMFRLDAGDLVQQKCVQLQVWPDSRAAKAECRHCGATWTGRLAPNGTPMGGIARLYEAIDDNVAEYGPIDFVLAPFTQEETPE